MKFTNLLRRISTSILQEHNPTRFCVRRGISRPNSNRGFFTGRSFHCNDVEEFEFEDEFVDFRTMAGDDPNKIHSFTVLNAEANFLRQTGVLVPKRFTTEQWHELLELDSKRDRIKYYKFLFVKEKKKESQKLMVARRAEELLAARQKRPSRASVEFTTSSAMRYGLSFNSLFFRIREGKMDLANDYHLLMAQMYGPHLVIDCSYEDKMSNFELHHCASQLSFGLASNRKSKNPFHIVHCNLDVNGVIMKRFKSLLGEELNDFCPFVSTDRNYLDLYPPKKLIYLSPHSDYEMEKYEPGYTYIIGAFVDETVHDPLSMEKAQRHGLRTARFPIQKYVNFCEGSELLPLNQCISIMSDLKNNCTWEEALKRIAPRKLTYSSLKRQKIVDPPMKNHFIKEMYGPPKLKRTTDNKDTEDEKELKEAG